MEIQHNHDKLEMKEVEAAISESKKKATKERKRVNKKSCPSTSVENQPCPAITIENEPRASTSAENQTCPDTTIENQPCASTSIENQSYSAATTVKNQSFASTLVENQPFPTTTVENQPCLSTSIENQFLSSTFIENQLFSSTSIENLFFPSTSIQNQSLLSDEVEKKKMYMAIQPLLENYIDSLFDNSVQERVQKNLEGVIDLLKRFQESHINQNIGTEVIADTDIANLPIITEFELTTYSTAGDKDGTELKNITRKTEDEGGDTFQIDQIIMPKKVQAKGRPKGAALTAIGLHRQAHAPKKFSAQHVDKKRRDILKFLCVDEHKIEAAREGEYSIVEKDIDLIHLPDSLVDKSVDIRLVEPYFEGKTFISLTKAIEEKKNSGVFTCGICKESATDKCVLCDQCLLWHHFECAGLKRAPRASSWFCLQCKD
ncbi:uncharacterized protein [Venturia canescens]|uniref:uncharacterized protein n=1 Tax=Venturia canescens TaxID=32260 RepID=UPI001C9CB5C0|nr:uncharacterized protein LOC122413567 [Venturia canescens]